MCSPSNCSITMQTSVGYVLLFLKNQTNKNFRIKNEGLKVRWNISRNG